MNDTGKLPQDLTFPCCPRLCSELSRLSSKTMILKRTLQDLIFVRNAFTRVYAVWNH